jgi:hypothetical protein
MPSNEVALVLPEPGTLALLEHDGQGGEGHAVHATDACRLPAHNLKFFPSAPMR